MKTIAIATFDKSEPARRLQQRLHEAGLQTIINDETQRERFGFLSEPRAAVHVEVEQFGYLRARRLLKELDATGDQLLREAVRCPDCGSSRVEFPQITRKFAMPMIEALLMKLHLRDREYYCEDCHFTWPERKREQPELDVLGFPKKKPGRSTDQQ
jgi:hypothetical protein